MAKELTGPRNCAECGAGLSVETFTSAGRKPAALAFRADDGETVIVPGLYICPGCAELDAKGELPGTVTCADGALFLIDSYIPRVLAFLERCEDKGEMWQSANVMLDDAVHACSTLAAYAIADAMEKAAGDDGDIMVIVVEEHAPTPRDMASMN